MPSGRRLRRSFREGVLASSTGMQLTHYVQNRLLLPTLCSKLSTHLKNESLGLPLAAKISPRRSFGVYGQHATTPISFWPRPPTPSSACTATSGRSTSVHAGIAFATTRIAT